MVAIELANTSVTNVQVFIEFLRLGEMNNMHGKYNAEVLVESKWKAPNNLITSYDPKSDWNPKLIIENIISANKETITYSVISENGSTFIMETRFIKGTEKKVEPIFSSFILFLIVLSG